MVVKTGSRGRQVAKVQERLAELGYLHKPVDGMYGPDTEEAIQFFRHQHGFEPGGELTDEQIELLFSGDAQKASRSTQADDPIGAVEMREILALVKPALFESDVETRRHYVATAILKFGLRFLMSVKYLEHEASGDMKTAAASLVELATDMLLSWLGGESFTEQADENELRALVGLDLIETGGLGAIRLAAESVLKLPPDHRLRDVNSLRSKLLVRIQTCREAGAWQDFVYICGTLLGADILETTEAAALADELLQVAENPASDKVTLIDEDRRRAFVSVAGWHAVQAVEFRDDDHDVAARHRESSRQIMQKAQAIHRNPQDVLVEALNLDDSGDRKAAADLLAPLADSDDKGHETAAWMEGMMRLGLGHYERSVQVLERVVSQAENRYLLATGDEQVTSAGERYSKDAVNLAFAFAFLGRWTDAVDTIDRTKSPRLRHNLKLRQSSAGTELLKLEAQLVAASRGVPDPGIGGVDKDKDPLGSRVSDAARALERYRRQRPDLGKARLTPPTLAQVGAALAADEAVVSLGSGFKGLMIAVVLPGDTDSPSGTFILEDLPGDRIVKLLFATEEISGWAMELAALAPVDPEPALQIFLNKTDVAFGKLLSDFLREHDVTRVTIIPHRVLHVIPFWALPSFDGLDVRTAPSMAQWFQAREKVARLTDRATAIGNPTLDLGLAAAEAQSVQALLARRGCRTKVLLNSDAHEGAIRKSVRKSALMHFAGHGKARPMEPMLSALLTHPAENWGWPVCGDPFAALLPADQEWLTTEGGIRYADIAEGRLVDELDEQGEVTFRRLEHGPTGTLWGRYEQGQLLQLAELWTTSDVLIEEDLADCALAFLGACESGRAAFRIDVDEDLGLPSALQMAGVDTVVCTLWPVGDVTALMFSEIFYRKLVAEAKGILDMPAMVADCRNELAAIRRDDAVAMLRETAAQLTGKVARAELAFVIDRMSSGPEQPFAHPYHWAAFFTQGVEHVEIPWD